MKESPFLENSGNTVQTLQRISFLSQMDERHLQSIFKMSKLRFYEKGEKIIVEGACESYLYILLSGEVTITKYDTVVAWLHQTGDIFGELAIIDYMPRSATATALTPTTCLAMDAAYFDSLPPADQAVIYAILYKSLAQIVTERLRSTSEELASLKRGIMSSATVPA